MVTLLANERYGAIGHGTRKGMAPARGATTIDGAVLIARK